MEYFNTAFAKLSLSLKVKKSLQIGQYLAKLRVKV